GIGRFLLSPSETAFPFSHLTGLIYSYAGISAWDFPLIFGAFSGRFNKELYTILCFSAAVAASFNNWVHFINETTRGYMNKNYRAAIWIMAVIGAGLWLVYAFGVPAPLSFCTVAAGVITFFHFMADPVDPANGSSGKDARLRAAIAGAVVVQYLVLVGIVAYFTKDSVKLPQITETLIGSFTTVVGVVVAFYFGSSAFIEARKKERGSDLSGPTQNGKDTK
ncbi:MAG: hypothetical protein KKD44_21090, partial [Proteobacteria bacterium]|nr:hypothetical protein [Pseudomonadota bacterium]